MTKQTPLTYAQSGVDIDAGATAVERIRKHVARTRIPEQLSDLGGFAGLCKMPSGMSEPVLVSCTDGVGTKLLVAIAMNRHDTVGIDLVAMNVNDLLVTGARPLFLLDYIAVARVDPAHVEQLVAGISQGCVQAGCALLGGETAELPGLYAEGHYDLAAFAVGVVDRQRMWKPELVRAGDVALALPSSGLHSNGYSLARKALLGADYANLRLADPLPTHPQQTVGEALITPTLIYAEAFKALGSLSGSPVHGAAHITGGGLLENPQRAFSDECSLQIEMKNVPLPPVMRAVLAQGVAQEEMLRTFNCGIGMLLYVDPERVDEVESAMNAIGQTSLRVGHVTLRAHMDAPQIVIKSTNF